MYTEPPRHVTMEDGRYIGTLDDGTRVRIPARSRTGRPMTTTAVDGRDVPANVQPPDFTTWPTTHCA